MNFRKTFSPLLFLTLLVVFPFPGFCAPEQKLDTGGTRLNYMDAGSGQPVVMIHGNHSSVYAFSFSVFDEVSKKYRAVAFDLSGYGKSRRLKRTMTFKDHAALLHEALTTLKIEKPVLVGHSMGAPVVLRYLLDYPGEARSAVLIAPYTQPFVRIRKTYRISKIPVIADLYIWTFVKPRQLFKRSSTWTRGAFAPGVPDKDYSRKEVRQALRTGNFKNAARDMYSLRAVLDEMKDRYGEIKVPVWIVVGDSDLISPAEEHAIPLRKKISRSELTVVGRGGHLLMFLAPAEVLKAIDSAAQS